VAVVGQYNAFSEWIRFRFAVDGLPVFSRKIAAPAGLVTDLSPAWEEIAKDFWETEKRIFEAEGAYEGLSRWQEWSEWYKKTKLPGTILTLTGRLKASLTGGPESIKIVTKTSLEIGSACRTEDSKWNLAVIHQYGSRISERNLDPRPVIRLTKTQKLRWSRIIANFIRRRIREAGA